MENIIKKAEEKGFNSYVLCGHDGNKYAQIVLDHLFWQALSKACGWEEKDYDFYETLKEQKPFFVKTSTYYALRFHEINLTEGWDKAISFLEDLIK